MFISFADPTAFTLGPITVRWYGLLFSGGFIIGYIIMQLMFRQKHYNTQDLDRLLVYIFAGTVLGARLGHCLIYEPDFYLSHPLEILKVWQGGLASHGGAIGVTLAVMLFNRKKKYGLMELGDMLCVPISLVACLIRVGNFMNSEILGIPTKADYGVIFARLGENFPRHPAQLYEALAYFLTFLILLAVYFLYKKRPHGLILGLMLIIIFSARLLIEPFKVEQADYSTGSFFTVGQYLSLPFVAVGIVIVLFAYASARRQNSR